MDWEKPSPELIRVLEEVSEPFELIERRKMFGCPAYYINGNMFAGVYGRQLFLRLPERSEITDVVQIARKTAAIFIKKEGVIRAMRGYR